MFERAAPVAVVMKNSHDGLTTARRPAEPDTRQNPLKTCSPNENGRAWSLGLRYLYSRVRSSSCETGS